MKSCRYAIQRDPNQLPINYPVTAGELAEWLRVEADDPLLTSFIATATEVCEDYTGLAFIEGSWVELLDFPPGGYEPWWDGVRDRPVTEIRGVPSIFYLHRAPLISVEEVNFYDESDVATLADPASYVVDSVSRVPRVALRSGFSWPSVVLRVINGVEVKYTAGFGDASEVPQAIKDAIKMLAGYLYSHRGACDIDDAIKSSGAAVLLSKYRQTRI